MVQSVMYQFRTRSSRSLLVVADDLNADENVDSPKVRNVERQLESRDCCLDGLLIRAREVKLSTCNTITTTNPLLGVDALMCCACDEAFLGQLQVRCTMPVGRRLP